MLRDVCPSPLSSLSFALILLSCSDVSGGGEGGGAGTKCSTPADCDDDEECTTNECNVADGLCAYPAVPAGTKCDEGAYECLGGVCNKCVESDGSTKDCDDGNECTFNECVPKTGACQELDKDDGTTCMYEGSPSICVEGDCAKPCTGDAECDDRNDCTYYECDVAERVCLYVDVPDGTDCMTSQAPGECMSGVCL